MEDSLPGEPPSVSVRRLRVPRRQAGVEFRFLYQPQLSGGEQGDKGVAHLPQRRARLFVAAVDQAGLRLGIVLDVPPGDLRPRPLLRRQAADTGGGVPAAFGQPAPPRAFATEQRQGDKQQEDGDGQPAS